MLQFVSARGQVAWFSGPAGHHGPAQKRLTGTANIAGNTLICGDLRLTGDVTINAPSGAVLYIENGLLDLQGYHPEHGQWIRRDNRIHRHEHGTVLHISRLTIGGHGTLDIEAPKAGPFAGMAIYQDPGLTRNVDFTYAGNSPTWDITGGVYLPNADVTMSGAVNKSTNGAECIVMVAKDILVNGTAPYTRRRPMAAVVSRRIDHAHCDDPG